MVVWTVPQLQIRFNVSWKLYWNIWNRGWLNSSLSLVISFKPLKLWQWKILFAKFLLTANIHFLKSAKLSEFFIFKPKFHSIIVEGKKEYLNMLSIKMRDIIIQCLVIYTYLAVGNTYLAVGINLKRYLGDRFLSFWKRTKICCTIVIAVGILSLGLDKIFLWSCICYDTCYLH